MNKTSNLLKYGLIIVVFFVMISFLYTNYQNTVAIIKSEYSAQHELVEKSIYNTIKYTDIIEQTIEVEQNNKMNEYSLMLLDNYRQQPNVTYWNLDDLKDQLGSYEIYIIDRNLKVIATTFQPDLGLDFKRFPSFSKLLKSRLLGESFIIDELDLATNTGQLKKYSYMPTPDHKYLIELGLNVTEKYPLIKHCDPYSAARDLTKNYKSVKEISIYKRNEKGNGVLKISKTKPYYQTVKDQNRLAYINKTIETNAEQVNTVKESSNTTTTYKYIPCVTYLSNGNYIWWNTRIIEVVYDDSVVQAEINQQKQLLARNILSFSILYLSFVMIIIYLLKKSEYMAYHDHLTKLPNRKLFEEHIKENIIRAKRDNHKLALLFMDLNKFKEINDTLGHKAGDMLLQEVAIRLKNNLRASDILCRIGGDEFVVLLPEIVADDGATTVAKKISDLLKEPVNLEGHQVSVRTSIGISIYPDHCEEPESLIQMADMAMYYAKNNGLDYAIYNKGW